jgi:hypothetical protein
LNFEVNSFLLRKKTHFPFSRLVFSVEWKFLINCFLYD